MFTVNIYLKYFNQIHRKWYKLIDIILRGLDRKNSA